MRNLHIVIACVASSALLLGACGPAPGEETNEVAESGQSEASKPWAPDMTELGMVEQQTMVGDLGGGMGVPIATYPTTCTASNQWATSCGSGSSRDISYVWTAPATGVYNFSTRNSSFDTILEIRNLRNTSEVIACNDDTSSTRQSSITLNSLIRGTRLLIIIEGYQGDCGSTHLNIRRL